jgi:hypothetical protein
MSQAPPDDGPSTYRYDPELPFLYELEREVKRLAQQAAGHGRSGAHGEIPSKRLPARFDSAHPVAALATPGPSGHAERRPEHRVGQSRTRTSSRVARRTLVLVALLCLVGASAFGAGHILSGAPNPTIVHRSAFVPVAKGREGASETRGGDSWSLKLYMRGGELCRVLVVGEAESSRCSAPPGAHTLGVTSVISPTRRYFYGVVGPAVARVEVHAGELASSVSTHSSPPALARAAGLPRGARWFVAIVGRPVGEPDPPAHVRGVGFKGRPVTGALIDCAETTEPQPCPR